MLRTRAPWPLLLTLTTCGAYAPPPPSPAASPYTFDRGVGPVIPTLYVAVVDDRPDAADLRQALAKAFDDDDAETALHSCEPPFDPAAFHPQDRSALVVHPSATGRALVTTELDQPGLHWVTNQASEAEHAAWIAEVTSALEPKDPELGAFAPLAALERVSEIMTRSRPPEGADEFALAGLVRDGQTSVALLAVAHDDESSAPPESLVPRSDDFFFLASVVVPQTPALPSPPSCDDQSGSTTPRYTDWFAAAAKRSAPPPRYWPCTDLPLTDHLYGSCVPKCPTFAPAVGADGSVDCHVTVETLAASCDSTYGWLDPLKRDGTRAPVVTDENGSMVRHCEIRQLMGAALDSCVNSLDCPDCEPGWCYTAVPELRGECDAYPNAYPNAFRFVVGSDRAAPGHARIECDTVE